MGEATPEVSIVVPTWPRLNLLTRCLEAVHAHTVGIDYELLVIDNGARSRGSTWGVNRGLRSAEANVLVVLHDDAVVQGDWLPPLLSALADAEKDYWVVSATDPAGTNWALNPWCYAFSRAGYERIGGYGYDERYQHWLQDCELPERVQRLGGAFARIDDSLVVHAQEKEPDAQRVAQLREWHLHDYGYEPATW